MPSRSKRRALTTDDLMHRQELAPRKRQKRPRDEDENSLRRSDSPAFGEDSQSDELSALDESEDDQDSTSEIPVQNEGEEVIPSRFSFKPRRGSFAGKTVVPPPALPLFPTFPEMGVSSSLVSAMNKMSIHKPTEIQVACIPQLLNGMYFLTRCFTLNAEDFGKVGIV